MDAVQAGWAETAALQLLFLSSSLAAVETAQAGCAMTMDADVTETETEITVAVDVAVNNHDFCGRRVPSGDSSSAINRFYS